MFSLVVPVYRNEASIPSLLAELELLRERMDNGLEVVFVVDGSPDRSYELLLDQLPKARFHSQLLRLSRNFGSFAAIRAGLAAGRGSFFGIISADLQEPIDLIVEFGERLLAGGCDVVVGSREGRSDPFVQRLCSTLFWRSYRFLIQTDMPKGGVDVFGCTKEFRDQLLSLHESNSTLVGLIFWLGYRRAEVRYRRRRRRFGVSSWSFRRRVRYLFDSAFAFSDLPIRLLSTVGVIGILLAISLGAVVLAMKIGGKIPVPGYAAIVLMVMFFGGVNSLSLGLVGEYLWRAFENTKGRPQYVVQVRSESGYTGENHETREGPTGDS